MHASRSSVRVTARVLGPLDHVLVVRRRRRRPERHAPVGREMGGEDVTRQVRQRQRVGQVVRKPREHRRRLGHVRARLEQVAQDERHPEPVAEHRPAAERERDRQAVLVDAVEQAPQAVARAHHALPIPCRVPDEPLQARGRVVVVSDEDRAAGAAEDALRAAAQVRRRVHHREHPRGHVAAAGQLDQPLPRRHELGHVLAQHPRRVGEARAGRLAVAQEPVPIRGPQLLEDAAPRLPRSILLHRAKCELDRLHSYNILNEKGSGGGTGDAGAAGSPVN